MSAREDHPELAAMEVGRMFPNSSPHPVTAALDRIDYLTTDAKLTQFWNSDPSLHRVNRVEVIDDRGRDLVIYGATDVTTDLQDGGRTLKLFVRGGDIFHPLATGRTK